MTTARLPARSLEQRLEALRIAKGRRKRRAYRKAVWRDAKHHEAVADLLSLLESPPDWAATWKVWDALLALPGIGQSTAFALIRRIGMSHVKTVGGISERQRHELAQALTATAERRKDGWKARTKMPCPDCGEPMDRRSTRCLACANGIRRAGGKPSEPCVCPECGGPMSPKATQMCIGCWGKHPRNPFLRPR